ncbi:hypothetical protein K450DRAFT_217981 [Umbelopsis ramanniana AG]|uniref:NudC domain-containing protein 1 n=1 Tax=Umbelopsis ramanniana AG TaxID=1314678 RepID=A0AAD5HJW1_UMBRA|nr:uncharacterized protein K450DRAFT_217981 [Umbelopsis ramanniana AG]KAI8584778.1 hypothetical protein K450DRAFT_217981 [Umbelopsis ramanniana AG]
MSSMSKLRFKSDRALINSKFDGYKLQVFPDDTNVHRFALPNVLSLPKLATNSKMSYRELQARVKFNHLFPSHRKGLTFYVDSSYSVIAVDYDAASNRARYHSIVQLQAPLSDIPAYAEPDSSMPLFPQYPSLISISSDSLIASNGMGIIYLIQLGNDVGGNITGKIVSFASFPGDGTEGLSPVPCVLQAARLKGSEIDVITWSVASQQNEVPSHLSADAPTSKTLFNVTYLKYPTNVPSEDHQLVQIIIQHIQRGRDIPFYCEIDSETSGYVLGSSHAYDLVHTNEDVTMAEDPEPEFTVDSSKPSSPYRWVQSSDDLTIIFQLPPNTPKTAISCSFDVRHLSLMVLNGDEPVISMPFRKLWDIIDSESSTWTFESSSGLLTIELAKKNENVRWLHVFEQDDNVHEDLSPDQLEEIRTRLEKFTGDAESKPMGIPGWSQPLQHPIATEMDDDIDHDGQNISLSWIDGNTGKVTAEVSAGGQEWISTSFPQPAVDRFPTICLKMDVDGLVYSIERADPITVNHIASFNALAFVQASKRDKRFIYHDPLNTFSIILEGSRNAYIYYRHEDGKRRTDVQTLVDLTQGHDIDVIGAQLIEEKVVIVLLESSVVILDLNY